MDKDKKEKLIAIIVLTIVSLVVAIVACAFGISAETLGEYTPEVDFLSAQML